MTLSSFQLDGISPGSRVAVAMSGGVDSSVAAALMVEAGYEVVGITLQLYDQGQIVQKKQKACCAGQDIYDARTVADTLGFKHYVLDYESIFKQAVIDDFVESYIHGETPIPCIQCNQKVKFRDLLTTAQDLGAAALVTGHYVQRVPGTERSELHAAVDLARDQSYFLFSTTQSQLDYLRFPLGGIPKSETRRHAQRLGLEIADKPDSQDICFVPEGGYAKVVERFRPGALEPGNIVDLDGRVLGQHGGIIQYTIGQRKGLGIAAPTPLYVIKLDPEKQEVVVGPRQALEQTEIHVHSVNWLCDMPAIQTQSDLRVKIRSHQLGLPAHVSPVEDNKAVITLLSPEYGVAAGQACVFYSGTRVLGGGWITSEYRKNLKDSLM